LENKFGKAKINWQNQFHQANQFQEIRPKPSQNRWWKIAKLNHFVFLKTTKPYKRKTARFFYKALNYRLQ